MRINHNLMAQNALRSLGTNGTNQSKSMEKLSSGLRINRAGDDAAGLAISEKMRGQIRGLDQASRNSQDGISLIQIAEGSLNETHDILQRMRELAVQSVNDTNATDDRGAIKDEMDQLARDIDRIANNTEFNTKKLLDGNAVATAGLSFQIGANEKQTILVKFADMRATALGVATGAGETAVGIDVSTVTAAGSAITLIDSAIKAVSAERSKLGATQNRLEHAINNLNNSSENLTAAESRVRDVDMAKEVMNQSKTAILAQAAQAMLAQANQQPQQVLQLLRG